MSFSRKRSVHAQRVIQQAFKELERSVAVPDACRFRDTTIEDVRKACETIENELGARGLLRNMGRLEPLMKGLECYSKTVDTLCQGTPFLPWIWAPVVTILKIASDCITAFETLIKAYAKIGESLRRFETLRVTFDDDPQFQEVVAIFYRDILKFHENAYKFVTVSGWRRFFGTTWGRFERKFEVLLDNLDRHGELIDKEANARSTVNTKALLKQLEAERTERLNLVHSEEKAEISRLYQAILARLQVNESDQSSIWEALANGQFAAHEGSCAWALKHAIIASWLRSDGDIRSLWLQGSAGAGKSVLAAHLAKFRSLDDNIVIRHFCNELYESSTKYDQILKTILCQLLQRSDDAIAHVYKALNVDRKPPAVSMLEPLIHELLAVVSRSPQEPKAIWIILDGVEACKADSLGRCIALMDSVTTKNQNLHTGTCKVLFTSRLEPSQKTVRKRHVVLLSEEIQHVRQSIRCYTAQRLQSPPVCERLSQLGMVPDEVAQLESDIAYKADGMFLYARLIIDYLSKQLFRTSQELKEVLRELPPELKGLYRKILSKILSPLSSTSEGNVKCVLHWIGLSYSPLKKMEILSAVTFGQGQTQTESLVPSYFIEDCFALLEEKQDKTIGFIHATVKNFLLDAESSISSNHRAIRRQQTLDILTCLTSAARHFASVSSEQRTNLPIVRGLYTFLNYAAKHWAEYVLSYAEAYLQHEIYDAGFWGALKELDSAVSGMALEPDVGGTISRATDPRVEYFNGDPRVKYLIQASLLFQAQNINPTTSTSPCQARQPVGAISLLLEKYQAVVRSILIQGSYLGISREEFEVFKTQAQTLLFTCRTPSCPSAATGFETAAELASHELEHSNSFPCRASGCQFPPFRSVYLLNKHFKKHHERSVPRRKLRHVREIHTSEHAPLPPSLSPLPSAYYFPPQGSAEVAGLSQNMCSDPPSPRLILKVEHNDEASRIPECISAGQQLTLALSDNSRRVNANPESSSMNRTAVDDYDLGSYLCSEYRMLEILAGIASNTLAVESRKSWKKVLYPGPDDPAFAAFQSMRIAWSIIAPLINEWFVEVGDEDGAVEFYQLKFRFGNTMWYLMGADEPADQFLEVFDFRDSARVLQEMSTDLGIELPLMRS